MTTALNGRVQRLERVALPAFGEHACRACGLRHVRPLTLALMRGVLRVAGGTGFLAPRPGPLCLCDPCCGEDRWLARMTHGLTDEEGA